MTDTRPAEEATPACLGKQTAAKPFAFPKSARLLHSSQFRRVMSTGKKMTSISFVLYFRAGESDCGRIGITVSRKVGNAVVRNRVKRLVREFFRLRRSRLKAPCDCVVIARPAAAQKANQMVVSQLEKLFVGLLRAE